jgi:hypothetical protein
MGLIEYYIIFALATGISSCYEFLVPAVAKAKEAGIVNTFTQSTWLCYVIYTITSAIAAPITILPIIFSSSNSSFRTGMDRVVMEQNE